MEWQPIETASRDVGKPVLVFDGCYIAVARPFSRDTWIIDNAFGFCEDGEIYNVTHWMPLPEPPK